MSKNNEQLQSAINDVAVIRQTLERSKVHLGKLSALFFWIGGIQLAAYAVKSLGLLYFVPQGGNIGMGILEYIKYATLILTFVLYLRIRRDVKETNNILSLQLFNFWGLLLFLIPVLKLIILLVYILFDQDNQMTMFAFNFSDTLMYASSIIGILATGIIINKRPLIIAAVVLFTVYPLLFFFIDIGGTAEITAVSMLGFFSNINAYASVILMLSYIALGVYFKLQNGGEERGNQ